jgi:hypothetical protein
MVAGATGALAPAQHHRPRKDEVGRAVPYITSLNGAALAATADDEHGHLIAGDTSFRDESLGGRR